MSRCESKRRGGVGQAGHRVRSSGRSRGRMPLLLGDFGKDLSEEERQLMLRCYFFAL
jgi:hypothetical protein